MKGKMANSSGIAKYSVTIQPHMYTATLTLRSVYQLGIAYGLACTDRVKSTCLDRIAYKREPF